MDYRIVAVRLAVVFSLLGVNLSLPYAVRANTCEDCILPFGATEAVCVSGSKYTDCRDHPHPYKCFAKPCGEPLGQEEEVDAEEGPS